MNSEKPFVDANVLLEIMLLRDKTHAAKQWLASHDARHYISPLSVHLCYHYCIKENIAPERVAEFLELFDIVPMDYYVVRLAQKRFAGKDFEDCLQAACAELGGCDQILTLDRNFHKNSGTKLKVRVLA